MENQSGIYPLTDKVLIKPDIIEEKTDGGIIIAESTKEQHQAAQAVGTLIAIGRDAFKNTTTNVYSGDSMKLTERRVERWDGTAEPGQRVMYAKYGGYSVVGKDGEVYQVMNDRDLTCAVDEGVKYTGIQSRKRMK